MNSEVKYNTLVFLNCRLLAEAMYICQSLDMDAEYDALLEGIFDLISHRYENDMAKANAVATTARNIISMADAVQLDADAKALETMQRDMWLTDSDLEALEVDMNEVERDEAAERAANSFVSWYRAQRREYALPVDEFMGILYEANRWVEEHDDDDVNCEILCDFICSVFYEATLDDDQVIHFETFQRTLETLNRLLNK